jgi:DNA excision repair protein ERCC-4
VDHPETLRSAVAGPRGTWPSVLHIVADDRERGSGVIQALEQTDGVSVSVRRLEEGDFLVERQFVVERKTVRDFAGSLIDGRLFKQAGRLSQSGRRRLLVLEGSPDDLRACHVSRESLQGALITLCAFFGIPVVRAFDAAETARIVVYLARQARRVAIGGLSRPGYRPKGIRARQLFILQGLPGIGPERAARLLERFGTIQGVMNASVDELAEVDGIGEKTARRIRAVLELSSETDRNNAAPEASAGPRVHKARP